MYWECLPFNSKAASTEHQMPFCLVALSSNEVTSLEKHVSANWAQQKAQESPIS